MVLLHDSKNYHLQALLWSAIQTTASALQYLTLRKPMTTVKEDLQPYTFQESLNASKDLGFSILRFKRLFFILSSQF